VPRTSPLAIAARVLLVPYLLVVALIVWLPAGIASRVTGIAFWFGRIVSEYTGISQSTSYVIFEFLANIALFVPLGLLVAAGWRQTNAGWVILLGFAASVTIELVQTLLPSRVPTLSDVVANTLGTVIGCCMARLFARRRPTPRLQPVPSHRQ
jgi:glycopeptide antibiotics resistance protein